MNTLFLELFPAMLFLVLRMVMPNVRYEFDFDQSHATFVIIYDRLAKIGWMIFGFGLVGAFAFQRFIGVGEASVTLLAAALFALMSNAWSLVAYEGYLHERYPRSGAPGVSNYTVTKYAVTITLGTTMVVFFIVGVIQAMRSV